jgi:hypothetical protein
VGSAAKLTAPTASMAATRVVRKNFISVPFFDLKQTIGKQCWKCNRQSKTDLLNLTNKTIKHVFG